MLGVNPKPSGRPVSEYVNGATPIEDSGSTIEKISSTMAFCCGIAAMYGVRFGSIPSAATSPTAPVGAGGAAPAPGANTRCGASITAT